MATFTETAYYTRKFVVVAAIGFVALIVGRIVFVSFSKWWIAKNPPPPPAPTVSFGVLPELQFPKSQDISNVSYRLETASGNFPKFETQMRVYFVPAFRANVLGLELATALAAKYGFLFAPSAKDEQVYAWTRETQLSGILTQNLITGHFTYETAWQKDGDIIASKAPAEAEAVRAAKDFLRRGGLLTADLDTGKIRIEFLRAEQGTFASAVSQSEASFTKVHIFRSDIDKASAVTPREREALVQVVVSGSRASEKQVIWAMYKYSPVEQERHSTYPLRSAQIAWDELQNGKAYVAQLMSNTSFAVIRTVELAYYDADVPQEFLQPVYVFRGDNGFVAYVPAIDTKWLSK